MVKKKTGKKDRFVIRGLSLQGVLDDLTGGEQIKLRKDGVYVIRGEEAVHESLVLALNACLCRMVSGTVVSKGPFEKAYIAIPPSYDVGFQGDVIKGKNLNAAIDKLIKKYGEEK